MWYNGLAASKTINEMYFLYSRIRPPSSAKTLHITNYVVLNKKWQWYWTYKTNPYLNLKTKFAFSDNDGFNYIKSCHVLSFYIMQ